LRIWLSILSIKRSFRWNETISFVQGSLCLFFLSLLVLTFWGDGKRVHSSEQEAQARPVIQSEPPPAAVELEKRCVKIDFDNVDIIVFIKFMGEVTGKNFVVDPKVQGKVSVVAPTAISADEAYEVFQSVLEVHGFTTVPAGGTIKIIPSSEAPGKAIDTQLVH
jgi:type II secretory pathway component GspD/PulD (secretin)